MSQRDKQEAAEKAERAGRQLKHAASNVGDATEAAAEHMKDEIIDGASKAKDILTPSLVNQLIAREAIGGTVAAALTVITGAIAVKKFGVAIKMRKNYVENLKQVSG